MLASAFCLRSASLQMQSLLGHFRPSSASSQTFGPVSAFHVVLPQEQATSCLKVPDLERLCATDVQRTRTSTGFRVHAQAKLLLVPYRALAGVSGALPRTCNLLRITQ